MKGIIEKEKRERIEDIKWLENSIEKWVEEGKGNNEGDLNAREGGARGGGFRTQRENRQLEELEWKIEQGERARKRYNIVITVWQERKGETETIEDWMKRKLGMEVINRASAEWGG